MKKPRQGGINAHRKFTVELWRDWMRNGTPTYADSKHYVTVRVKP